MGMIGFVNGVGVNFDLDDVVVGSFEMSLVGDGGVVFGME